MSASPRRRVLLLYPGPVPPPREPGHSQVWYLAQSMTTGDVISSTWRTRAQHAEELPDYERALGGFGYHATRSHRLPSPLRTLWDVAWFVTTGVRLARRRGRYDVIVGHGPFKTGLAAVFLGRLTRTPVIVELPGHPFRAFQFGGGRLAGLKARVARRFADFVVRRADHLHLLYPGQLDDLPAPAVTTPTSVFPDFVRASQIPPASLPDQPYVLFLGHPWHLKGVDVLLRAWRLVTHEFPRYRLRIVGYCPDRTPFERLADGLTTIDFEKPTPRGLEYIANSDFLVLASRTEAAPRVVLEAMLAGKAVVATNVDGIPTYVHDGVTGLLFPSEDHEALADCLRRLLGDAGLRARLGARAQEIARTAYTEEAWAASFSAMVEQAVTAGRGAGGR